VQQLFTIQSYIQSYYLLGLLALFSLSFLFYYISRHYILRVLQRLTIDNSSFWGQVLFAPKLLSQLSMILPFAVYHYGSKYIVNLPPLLSLMLSRITLVGITLLSMRALNIILWKINEVYSSHSSSRNRPIKGIIQVAIILIYGTGIIVAISILIDKSPLIFLSGLGAMTAILLLIFRDTILSLVAGVQLTTNDLIQVGDWIEMPQFNADGDVIDIALHAVKVQNWDKTITMIPTHKFLENSFKNWRGMQEAGGRRMKRSLLINTTTIRFLTSDEIERFKNFALLKDYILKKEQELKEHNAKFEAHLEVNSRRLTNVGTFRAYITNYLRQHPKVHQQMTFLVRQLPPTEHGLPIEIYVFINDITWANYEAAQADIFDHLLAIIGEFGLQIHQTPTGHDLQALAKRI
jgi:miniconductance mechanosensitive channel